MDAVSSQGDAQNEDRLVAQHTARREFVPPRTVVRGALSPGTLWGIKGPGEAGTGRAVGDKVGEMSSKTVRGFASLGEEFGFYV